MQKLIGLVVIVLAFPRSRKDKDLYVFVHKNGHKTKHNEAKGQNLQLVEFMLFNQPRNNRPPIKLCSTGK